VKRPSLAALFGRGLSSALATWKGLLLLLAVNALLAFVLTRPVAASLHEVLDRNPLADRLLKGADALFFLDFTRAHPDVLGDTRPWEGIASGGGDALDRGEPREVLRGFAGMSGASGALLAVGLANALLSALLAGGFAGRFGADSERGSLAAFGADVGRFGVPSLLLGILSIVGLVAAYRWVFVASGALYDPRELRYEWEAVALLLGRLLVFLLVAAYVRRSVLYARAAMGLSRSVNPLGALFRGAGFVAGRPVRTLLLEILFAAAGLLPLALWASFAESWDGKDPAQLALLLALQQVVLFIRIAARVGHLGAASAWMRRAAEAPPAPTPSAEPAAA